MGLRAAAVVGTGRSGRRIALAMALRGVHVQLVDVSLDNARAAKKHVHEVLLEALGRRRVSERHVEEILLLLQPVADLDALDTTDLVIEAVAEDLTTKKEIVHGLARVCEPHVVIATNTSTLRIAELAGAAMHPQRIVGLHHLLLDEHRALVEVVGHPETSSEVLRATWVMQETLRNTPIAAADRPGFVGYRLLLPYLLTAVRMREEGHALATVEAAAREAFGTTRGPFALIRHLTPTHVVDVARGLAPSLGPLFEPPDILVNRCASDDFWQERGEEAETPSAELGDRLWGVVCHVAADLLAEGVACLEDIDAAGELVGGWAEGPCAKLRADPRVAKLAQETARQRQLGVPALLRDDGERIGVLSRAELKAENGLGTLTLRRPGRRNALDLDMLGQLEDLFGQAAEHEAISAICIAGAGAEFMEGLDLRFLHAYVRDNRYDELVDFFRRGQRLLARIEGSHKPVVCRLHGRARGAGSELALACHSVVATPTATLAFPETRLGFYPAFGTTQRLTKRLGCGMARYLLYTCRRLSPWDLSSIGLAWQVVQYEETSAAVRAAAWKAPTQPGASADDSLDDFEGIADFLAFMDVQGLVDGSSTLPGAFQTKRSISKTVSKLLRRAPLALKAIERLTNLAERSNLEDGMAAELEGLPEILASRDLREGIVAHWEGRRARFDGR